MAVALRISDHRSALKRERLRTKSKEILKIILMCYQMQFEVNSILFHLRKEKRPFTNGIFIAVGTMNGIGSE